MRPLCIYHGGCDDGFGAAFVVNLFFAGEVDFHYGVYHQEPPDVSGRDVLLVDFSYARAVLERMAKQARSIVILDHHKSAAEDLASFAVQDSGRDAARWHDVPRLLRELAALGRLPVVAVFDMSRSGAGLTWDFFFCSRPRPWLIDYIEDRDLWRKALPHSDEIIMALASYPHDFETWQRIIDAGPDAPLADGRAPRRCYRTPADALKRTAVRASSAASTCRWSTRRPSSRAKSPGSSRRTSRSRPATGITLTARRTRCGPVRAAWTCPRSRSSTGAADIARPRASRWLHR